MLYRSKNHSFTTYIKLHLKLIIKDNFLEAVLNKLEYVAQNNDYVLIGGGMVYTFLKAMGYNIGLSIVDDESIVFCKKMLSENSSKIILPEDISLADGDDYITININVEPENQNNSNTNNQSDNNTNTNACKPPSNKSKYKHAIDGAIGK